MTLQQNEIYLVSFTAERGKLETETWFGCEPSHRAVPAIVVMAEKLEAEAKRKIDELWDEADRGEVNPWDTLTELSAEHFRAIAWLAALRNDRECTCMPDGSTTCEPCQVGAQVRYAYEKFINASDGDSSAVTEQDGKE